MTDIMQNWKNRRFVVADSTVTGTPAPLVVLSDIGYWVEHYEALVSWCKENGCHAQGMTVEIPDQSTLTLFCLRWS